VKIIAARRTGHRSTGSFREAIFRSTVRRKRTALYRGPEVRGLARRQYEHLHEASQLSPVAQADRPDNASSQGSTAVTRTRAP
jgi:hypothetical protein